MPRENPYLIIICKILEGKSEKLVNSSELVIAAASRCSSSESLGFVGWEVESL